MAAQKLPHPEFGRSNFWVLFISLILLLFSAEVLLHPEYPDYSETTVRNVPNDSRLNDFISYYDPVVYEGVSPLNQKHKPRGEKIFLFRAFNRHFRLILRIGSPLMAPGIRIVTHGDNHTRIIPSNQVLQQLVTGTVDGEKYSHVQGYVVGGVFEGIITLSDETYYVESARSYFPQTESLGFKSLIFRRSDINVTALMCGVTGPCQPFRLDLVHLSAKELMHMPMMTLPESPPGTITRKELKARKKPIKPKKRICTVKLVADHTFYQLATDHTIEMAIHEMMMFITVADAIFRSTDFDLNGNPDGIGFQVASVVVWKSKDDANYKLFREGISSEDFLSAFATHDASDVCVAVCFVHRMFPGNVLGLAYTASIKRNHAGGICQKRIASRPARSYNTAVVTVEGSTGRMPRALNGLTLTHELGHSFGSDHDPRTERCSPSEIQGGAYLMADTIENSSQTNNNKFSPCSIESINRVLNFKGTCLLAEEEIGESLCGNAIRENGEECDCGLREQCTETDKCCVPKGGLGPEVECSLIKSAECSPRNGPCCNENCDLIPKADKMVCSRQECTEVSYCLGESAECPTSKVKPDGTACNRGDGSCYRGKCTDKTCARNNMHECSCSGWKFACHLCCLYKGLCMPASHLGIRGIHNSKVLKPNGESCNLERGVCEDGHCTVNGQIVDTIKTVNGTEVELEDDEDEGISVLATLLGITLVIILFIIIMLLLYFLTPFGSCFRK